MTGPAWIDEIAWAPTGPPWLAMGLSRIDDAAWLLPDEARDGELAERARLLDQRRDEVFAALPGTEAASAEVLALVRQWERRHRPDLAEAPVDPSLHPLEAAGRRTQEDLVLMVDRDGSAHLDAAVLCFPSHWRLRDKVGGSALAIHGPVPRYREDLAEKVDRFLDRLRPDVLVARRNWSVHLDDALFSPDPPLDPSPVTAGEVGDGLWLRSERQTLRRLPSSGVVLFTIRVQQAPFSAFAGHPGAARAMADRLEAQPAELTRMNGMAPHRVAAVSWLRSVAPTRS
ncbi:heme-dependent oxidative N-demethylase family protein [Aquihabitans sp. McL0605]|uniref:heme-dependent oxidative N-demethylase family protein n=1 Tax=Aquihabitans sp. McL0605 TaxID=3415671 RepID=UPI003CF2441A